MSSYQPIVFSVVTVALNAGPALASTVRSVIAQTWSQYELIVKDGGSLDGTLKLIPDDKNIRIIESKDTGIYDAMNQALVACRGRYVIFLNAGDGFTGPTILEQVAKSLEEANFPEVAYMNFKNLSSGLVTHYRSQLTPFYLYRRFICHQVQIIRRDCFEKFGVYDTTYRIYADADFFARLVVRERLRPLHVAVMGVYYEGAGMSESAAQGPVVRSEMKRVRLTHYRPALRFWFGLVTEMTLPRARQWFFKKNSWPLLHVVYDRIAAIFR